MPHLRKQVKDFEEKFKHYKKWTFDFEYPGYMVYYHNTLPFSVYFTPHWNERNEVAIQINNKDEAIDGASIPFFSGDSVELFHNVKQWLDWVEHNIEASKHVDQSEAGLLAWNPNPFTWRPRKE